MWDSGLIDEARRGEDGWLADLVEIDNAQNRPEARGAVEDWATESLVTARVAYTDTATGQRIKPGAKLGAQYQEANQPVVRWRLYKAGIRLARVLNEALSLER